jgi:hypothetical protein
MNEQYPNLSWALMDNLYFKTVIFEEYKHNSRYLSYLNSLISELISYKCEGIQEKLKDVKTLEKLSSILSELEFALFITKNKEIKDLKLLSDDYLPSKSPDILFQDEVFTSYVEVTKVNENPYITDIILSRLREVLKSHPYRVDISLNTELSTPKMKRPERYIQKDLVEKSLETFEESFQEKLIKNTLATSSLIETEGLIFTVEKTDSGIGYPRFVKRGFIEVPTDILCTYIKERLVEKAVKRDSFEKEHRKIHYIIALDWHEPSIDAINMSELLYGYVTHLAALNITGSSEEDFIKKRSDYWNFLNDNFKNSASCRIIEQAKDRGWENLLIEKCLIPNNYSYIDKEGIFLSKKEMNNVTGVLFRDEWNNITFHPNPFCDAEINDPKFFKFI